MEKSNNNVRLFYSPEQRMIYLRLLLTQYYIEGKLRWTIKKDTDLKGLSRGIVAKA